MRFVSYTLAVAVLLVGGAATFADEKADKEKDPLGKAFEQLKSLTGEWKVTNGGGEVPTEGKITYRVIGNGSAVIETLFPGTKMEMVSVYHRDGKKLLMTHYCAAGNQPRFLGRIDKKTGDLVLDFKGGTNLNVKSDMHIHGGRFKFVDKDHFVSEWEHWMGGKKGGVMQFKLERVK